MVLDLSGRFAYPDYHQWSTNNKNILVHTNKRPFTLSKATSLDSRLPTINISRSTAHTVVIVVNRIRTIAVAGTISDINKTFVHYYNHSTDHDRSLVDKARLQLIKLMFTQSSVNEVQAYNALKQYKHNMVGLDQAISYQLLEQCKHQVIALCKFCKQTKAALTVDDAIQQKLNIDCDLLLVNKQYKQKQMLQQDVMLLRDRRFKTTLAKHKLHAALINYRLETQYLFAIKLTSSMTVGKQPYLVDPINVRKYTTYFTKPKVDIRLTNIEFDRTMTKPTLFLSDGTSLKIDGDTVMIKQNSSTFNIRLELFKTLLNPSINNDWLSSYKNNVDRFKTVLKRLNKSINASAVVINHSDHTIDEASTVFMELSLLDQVKASQMVNLLDHLTQSLVDNQGLMWEYIISLPRTKTAIKYISI